MASPLSLTTVEAYGILANVPLSFVPRSPLSPISTVTIPNHIVVHRHPRSRQEWLHYSQVFRQKLLELEQKLLVYHRESVELEHQMLLV